MQPFDKFGNRIYPNIFNKLLEIGEQLLRVGYLESIKKPNLFYKKIEQEATILNFLDMRGTEEIKIWEEPVPLMYQKIEKGELWQVGRIVKREIQMLKENNIPYRFSFEGWIEGTNIDEGSADGYCITCRKDLQSDKIFCSEHCEQIYNEKEVARIKQEAKERELERKQEFEERKADKEMGNPIINDHNQEICIEPKIKQKYYRSYCRLNMKNKDAMRYLRSKLVKDGIIGIRKNCENPGCYNFAYHIHEKVYAFDKLFDQDNYISLCNACHSTLHKQLKRNR